MKPYTLVSIAVLMLSLAACGDDESVLVGLWTGETASCTDKTYDGQEVRLSIMNGPSDNEIATFSSLFASSSTAVTACELGNASIDGYAQEATFDVVNECDDDIDRSYTVDVAIAEDEPDQLSGDVSFEGGECSIELTRVDTP